MKIKKLLLWAGLTMGPGFAQAQNDTVSKDSNDKVIAWAEQQPEFPGGEKALIQFLKNCPPIDTKIEDPVYVRFIIEKNGKISNVEIAKGADQNLNVAALECVKKMPDWKPAEQNRKPVRVQYLVPVFDNKEAEKNKSKKN